jgi:uncharacterized OB-fold protein
MQEALAPEISTWPNENPQPSGSRCGSCGATTFPTQDRCPKCSKGAVADVLLPRSGTLVAWTTQGFPPGRPVPATVRSLATRGSASRRSTARRVPRPG